MKAAYLIILGDLISKATDPRGNAGLVRTKSRIEKDELQLLNSAPLKPRAYRPACHQRSGRSLRPSPYVAGGASRHVAAVVANLC